MGDQALLLTVHLGQHLLVCHFKGGVILPDAFLQKFPSRLQTTKLSFRPRQGSLSLLPGLLLEGGGSFISFSGQRPKGVAGRHCPWLALVGGL
jgi:hypothetical protein